MHCGIIIRHPEAARFFTPIYRELTSRGHDVSVFVREHTHTVQLLRSAGVPHHVLAGEPQSRGDLVAGHAAFEARLTAAARRRDVDVLTAIGGIAITHLAPLVGARSAVFVDWDRSGIGDTLVAALADVVCTPQFVTSSYGDAHVRYDGYHELAYLGSGRFSASRAAVSALGIDRDSQYVVASFLTAESQSWWDAASIASHLDDCGDLYLTHDSADPSGDLATLPLSETLDALAFADLYIGDSATTAAEAAILGTPSVLLQPQDARVARCTHLADRYGLLVAPSDRTSLYHHVVSLLNDPDVRETFHGRREALFDETVDVARFATDHLIDTAHRDEA